MGTPSSLILSVLERRLPLWAPVTHPSSNQMATMTTITSFSMSLAHQHIFFLRTLSHINSQVPGHAHQAPLLRVESLEQVPISLHVLAV